MKLYLISQSYNHGYDTYSHLVVCAESEDAARLIHPENDKHDPWKNYSSSWCKTPDQVKVEYIGEASSHLKEGILCYSFHAG